MDKLNMIINGTAIGRRFQLSWKNPEPAENLKRGWTPTPELKAKSKKANSDT